MTTFTRLLIPAAANAILVASKSAKTYCQSSSKLEKAYGLYNDSCVCGKGPETYTYNCAHFLSDALIRAGYDMSGNYAKCPSGRLLRAKDVRQWAAKNTPKTSCPSSGFWLVYQENNLGQGHVCIHKEEGMWHSNVGRGGEYPNWPVQWHYAI